MHNGTLLPLDLPTVARKRATAGFDGGRLSSKGAGGWGGGPPAPATARAGSQALAPSP
jgi:hypothetical protein